NNDKRLGYTEHESIWHGVLRSSGVHEPVDDSHAHHHRNGSCLNRMRFHRARLGCCSENQLCQQRNVHMTLVKGRNSQMHELRCEMESLPRRDKQVLLTDEMTLPILISR